MIAVLMGEEDAIELGRGDPALLESDHDLPRAQSAIDQNPAVIRRDERAISSAAAAEHGQGEHRSISSGHRRVSQIRNGNAMNKNTRVVVWRGKRDASLGFGPNISDAIL